MSSAQTPILVQTSLTKEQKEKIYKMIFDNMQENDPYPNQVIRDKFEGNEEKYLYTMARYHGITL